MSFLKEISITILLILFASTTLFSQNSCIFQSFIIEIEEEHNIPTSTSNPSNNTITLTHTESYITDIFSNYVVYGFEQTFPNATSEALKKYYTINCASKDLINELHATVPNDVFFIESNYEGTTIDEDVINFFNIEKIYNLKEYISTSDGSPCTFDCDLNAIPNGFNFSVKVYYDVTKEQLIIESAETTSCGNSFKVQFKKLVDGSENEIIIWETISDTPCFEVNNNFCEIEKLFFETVLSNFDLKLTLNQGSFLLKSNNQVFGENVMYFEEESLSVNNQELKKLISITPNPVKDFIELKNLQELSISKASIFDYSGKEIISIKNSLNIIDTSLLSSGAYFLQVKTTKGVTINRKIIKQ